MRFVRMKNAKVENRIKFPAYASLNNATHDKLKARSTNREHYISLKIP